MRIIGGRLKGKAIEPPQGYKARPTTDFAKEAEDCFTSKRCRRRQVTISI